MPMAYCRACPPNAYSTANRSKCMPNPEEPRHELEAKLPEHVDALEVIAPAMRAASGKEERSRDSACEGMEVYPAEGP